MNIRVVAMRVFFIFISPLTFHGFRTCFEVVDGKYLFSKNGPEVSGSGQGAAPDLFSAISDPFRQHKMEHRLTHSYY